MIPHQFLSPMALLLLPITTVIPIKNTLIAVDV